MSDVYDFLAERFRALAVDEVPLERIMMDAEDEGFTIWEIPRKALYNAMRARGIEVANGVMSRPTIAGEHFDPVANDYQEFRKAAARVIAETDAPLTAMQITEATGLTTAAIPLANLRTYLAKAGAYRIPGVGYWRYAHWTMPDGTIIRARLLTERREALARHFERYGYPVVGPEVEAATNGVVTSQFLTRQASDPNPIALGIGAGLYVPAGKEALPVPLSPQVAVQVLQIDPGAFIRDREALLLFRVASILERKGLARLKKSRTSINGKRCQTMRIALTKEGRAKLNQIAKPRADDY